MCVLYSVFKGIKVLWATVSQFLYQSQNKEQLSVFHDDCERSRRTSDALHQEDLGVGVTQQSGQHAVYIVLVCGDPGSPLQSRSLALTRSGGLELRNTGTKVLGVILLLCEKFSAPLVRIQEEWEVFDPPPSPMRFQEGTPAPSCHACENLSLYKLERVLLLYPTKI